MLSFSVGTSLSRRMRKTMVRKNMETPKLHSTEARVGEPDRDDLTAVSAPNIHVLPESPLPKYRNRLNCFTIHVASCFFY
ncbi:hypothetical protein QQF64_033859 [Cirrhinus molitorella]|uniref:Uncharacterized protein n=1 Tax=Cirrhinus molitorella TaxID=172907 RepID=A0ABR3MV14_9TELE